MSDTPRTDAAETRANASTNPYSVLREHARDLERKLAEAMDRSQEDWVALTQRAERAEAALADMEQVKDRWMFRCEKAEAKLTPSPDVAKIIEAVRSAELFEDGVSADLHCAGIVTLPAAYLAGRIDGIDELAADLSPALLSQAAQLQKKEAECEGLRQDAERYRFLRDNPDFQIEYTGELTLEEAMSDPVTDVLKYAGLLQSENATLRKHAENFVKCRIRANGYSDWSKEMLDDVFEDYRADFPKEPSDDK